MWNWVGSTHSGSQKKAQKAVEASGQGKELVVERGRKKEGGKKRKKGLLFLSALFIVYMPPATFLFDG